MSRADEFKPSGLTVAEVSDLKAEIERLSRERDTGVPEVKTALGLAHAALTAHNDWHQKQTTPEAIDGVDIVPADAYADSTLYELTQDAIDHVERMEAALSAAPQPPTVSTQGWQDISTAPKGKKILVWAQSGITGAPRTMLARFYDVGTLPVAEGYENEDWAQEVDGEYYMPPDWYEEFEGEEPPAHNVTPTHWMPLPAKPGEQLASQPDLSTLTRERDQAREALAVSNTAAEMLRAQITLLGHVPCVVKSIDSLLNPEKEEKA